MDGRKPQEARFRVSEMGVSQTPKRFLPSKLHEVQLDSCPPPLPPPTHALFGRRKAALAREGDFIFHTLSFSKRATAPFETPGGERKRGKIIYLFGDGVFGGKLLQSPKGDSCRGEGANTGSRAVLSALCPGGLAVAAVFFGK